MSLTPSISLRFEIDRHFVFSPLQKYTQQAPKVPVSISLEIAPQDARQKGQILRLIRQILGLSQEQLATDVKFFSNDLTWNRGKIRRLEGNARDLDSISTLLRYYRQERNVYISWDI